MNNNEYNTNFKRCHWKCVLKGTNREEGHMLFLHKQTRMLAIADYSAEFPHETDDGVLWVDYSRSINKFKKDEYRIPLIKIDDDCSIHRVYTFSNERTAFKIQSITGHKIVG